MSLSQADLVRMAAQLELSGTYRVLPRFRAPTIYGAASSSSKLHRLMVVSVACADGDGGPPRPFEFGYVVADFDSADCRVLRVVAKYQGREDPGGPLPAALERLWDIKSGALVGERFDGARVAGDLASVDLVISHDAAHDRPALESRFPSFSQKWFACSTRECDWQLFGAECSQLDYLAFRLGGVYLPDRRALTRAEALVDVLALSAEGVPAPLAQVVANSKRPSYRVYAAGAPPRAWARLRAAGYGLVAQDAAGTSAAVYAKNTLDRSAELAWLGCNVLPEGAAVAVEVFTGRERYSQRLYGRGVFHVPAADGGHKATRSRSREPARSAMAGVSP